MATISNVFKPNNALNTFLANTTPQTAAPAAKPASVFMGGTSVPNNGFSAKPASSAATPFNGGSTPNNLFSGGTPGLMSTVPNFQTTGGQNTTTPTYPTTQSYAAPVVNNSGGYVSTPGSGSSNTGATYAAPTPQPTSVYNPQPLQAPAPAAPIKGLFSTVASSLAGSGDANAALGQNAQNIASDAAAQIADTGRQGARFAAGQRTTGTSPVAEGNAAVTAQTTAAEQQAIAAGANVALQGNQQALSAQGQTQSALSSAGNLTQPNPASYGQAVFDPVTGTYSGGGSNLDPQTQATSLAQKVMSGQMTYDQAISSLSYAGSVGSNFLNNAITQAGGNPLTLQATGSAQQSNIQTQGTLNTQIGAQGVQQATQNYVAAKTSYDTASQQATNLQNTLSTTGINQNPQFVNQKINALQNQLGSANYASFITALNETKQAYTSLLSSVGASTPTVNGQQATDIFNENSTPAQINAAIDALNTASYAKLKPLYDQIGTYSNIGSNGSGGSTANPWH